MFTRGRSFGIPASIIYIAAIYASPLPAYYIYSGALEIQSGVFLGIFVCSCILLWEKKEINKVSTYSFLTISGTLFPLYKDTSIAVVLVAFSVTFALAYFFSKKYPKKIDFRYHPRLILYLLPPIICAVIISLLYNHFRYDEIFPSAYISESELTSPSLYKSLEFFVASFFSPNGGILIFWTLPLFVAVFSLYSQNLRISCISVTISVLIVLLSASGYSLWWAPFGWDAWGNRLMVPAGIASLIILIFTSNSASTDKNRDLPFPKTSALKKFAFIVGLPILGSSAYYTAISHYGNKQLLWANSLNPGPQCEQMYEKLRNGDAASQGLRFWKSEIYYLCAQERFLHLPI